MDKMLVYEWFHAHGMEFLKRVSVLCPWVWLSFWNNVLTASEWYTHSQLDCQKKVLQC